MTMGAMDHVDVRDILEDAAIEPGGLERLMAGDTPNAALVASHLAGCPDCSDELERLRRSVALIGPTVRDAPPAELRERTLAFVAAVGRPRGEAARTSAPAPDPIPFPASPSPVPAGVAGGDLAAATPVASRRTSRVASLLAIAAALVLAVAGTAYVASSSRDAELRLQALEIEALGDVARATLHLDQQPDVRRVTLARTAGAAAGAPTGQLTFSPATTELVVVADGLTPAATGHEYRCWVETNGTRTPIGKMFFGGDVAYWVGPVPAVSGLGPDSTFGVSLVDLGTPGATGEPVLSGAG
jgi:hypothetical protein